MVVAVGSQNQCKVKAVASVLREFPEYATAEARGFAAPTGVSAQPMAVGEIVTGAKHRAEAAAAMNAATAPPPALAFSVGIESGLMQVEGEGYYDVCACSVWDGTTHHVGFSCAFKIPRAVIDNLLQNGCELSEAINNVGLANDANVGRKNGLIGIMTGDRVTRQQYTEQAVHMALVSVRNRAWFQNDTASAGADAATIAAKKDRGSGSGSGADPSAALVAREQLQKLAELEAHVPMLTRRAVAGVAADELEKALASSRDQVSEERLDAAREDADAQRTALAAAEDEREQALQRERVLREELKELQKQLQQLQQRVRQ